MIAPQHHFLTRSVVAQVSHVSQHSVVPPLHRLQQDPTFCGILWSRRSRLGTASHRSPRFAAFCGPTSVLPRYRSRWRLPQDLTFCSILWSCLPPRYRPQRRLLQDPTFCSIVRSRLGTAPVPLRYRTPQDPTFSGFLCDCSSLPLRHILAQV